MRFCFAALLALGCAFGATAQADVALRISFAYLDAASGAAVPAPKLTATSLYRQAPIAVLAPELAPEGRAERVVQLSDADFDGPYARVRLALADLRLPDGDARADRDLSFAFEVILRRDLLGDEVALTIPVIVSSRKGAVKPLLADPPIAEDIAGRFFIAQQYMAAYQAPVADVAAAPGSFALHRLIARAMADFALKLTDQRGQGVQLVPAPEMARDIALYWQSDRDGRAQHLRAYADARSMLWTDLTEVETILRAARRGGIAAVGLCADARARLDFFERRLPDDGDAARVDQLFPNPGSLAKYLAGRRLDVKFACGRFAI